MFDEKIKEFKKLTIKEFVDIANPHSVYEIKEDDEG